MSQKNDERDLLEVVQKLWSDNHLLQSRLRQAKAAATEAIHRRSESEAAVEKERSERLELSKALSSLVEQMSYKKDCLAELCLTRQILEQTEEKLASERAKLSSVEAHWGHSVQQLKNSWESLQEEFKQSVKEAHKWRALAEDRKVELGQVRADCEARMIKMEEEDSRLCRENANFMEELKRSHDEDLERLRRSLSDVRTENDWLRQRLSMEGAPALPSKKKVTVDLRQNREYGPHDSGPSKMTKEDFGFPSKGRPQGTWGNTIHAYGSANKVQVMPSAGPSSGTTRDAVGFPSKEWRMGHVGTTRDTFASTKNSTPFRPGKNLVKAMKTGQKRKLFTPSVEKPEEV